MPSTPNPTGYLRSFTLNNMTACQQWALGPTFSWCLVPWYSWIRNGHPSQARSISIQYLVSTAFSWQIYRFRLQRDQFPVSTRRSNMGTVYRNVTQHAQQRSQERPVCRKNEYGRIQWGTESKKCRVLIAFSLCFQFCLKPNCLSSGKIPHILVRNNYWTHLSWASVTCNQSSNINYIQSKHWSDIKKMPLVRNNFLKQINK